MLILIIMYRVHLHYIYLSMKRALLCSTTTVRTEQIIIIIVDCNLFGTKRYSNWSSWMIVTRAVSCWIPISIIIILLLSSAPDERVRHNNTLNAKGTINIYTATVSRRVVLIIKIPHTKSVDYNCVIASLNLYYSCKLCYGHKNI